MKPLEGNLFHKLRDQIMGTNPSNEYHSDHSSVLHNVELHVKEPKTTAKCRDMHGEMTNIEEQGKL